MPERQILDAADRVMKRNNAIPVLKELLEEQIRSNRSDKNYMFDSIKGVILSVSSIDSYFAEFLHMPSFYKKEKDSDNPNEIIDEIVARYRINGMRNIVYLALAIETALIKGECDFIVYPEWVGGVEIAQKYSKEFEDILTKLHLKGELNSYDEGRINGCVFHITK